MDFHERKKERIQRYFQHQYGFKQRPCRACSGSGIYDHNGSPPCGACDGTGKEWYEGHKRARITELLKRGDWELVNKEINKRIRHVEVTIKFELPDCYDWEDPYVGQALEDAYMQYVVKKHAEDALNWTFSGAKKELEDPNAVNTDKIIAKYHNDWLLIAGAAKYDIKITPSIPYKD